MLKNVKLDKEVVVGVANNIGVLADMSKILADHGINILAVAGYSQDKEARIMLVSDDNLRAVEALKKNNYKTAKESQVVIVELQDTPGALRSITEKLAAKDIDIKYIYGTTCPGGCPARIVISTQDNDKAVVALNAK